VRWIQWPNDSLVPYIFTYVTHRAADQSVLTGPSGSGDSGSVNGSRREWPGMGRAIRGPSGGSM